MTPQEAIDFVRTSGGRVFSVEFTKRTDGSVRNMVCRLGVKSHLRGGGQAYDPREKNLIVVFDMAPGKGYRSIPVEAIRKIKIDGVEYTIV